MLRVGLVTMSSHREILFVVWHLSVLDMLRGRLSEMTNDQDYGGATARATQHSFGAVRCISRATAS
ncbi:hypothetical protein EB834_06020 [Brevibacterium aurantiacum]|uniref:Uncharacterized protein n=1 Tax=Brevibacterium aurantiacum TaxID=273384 RepID=A0A4Z0KNJ8_BREAU|nr:hypothetical protein EB834_06020 [Brevibacterium aurantiacum]